jgi:hypothetical protein
LNPANKFEFQNSNYSNCWASTRLFKILKFGF